MDIKKTKKIANQQFKDGKYKEALSGYLAILDLQPNKHRDSYKRISFIYEQMNDHAEALKYYKKAAQIQVVSIKKYEQERIKKSLGNIGTEMKAYWNRHKERPSFVLHNTPSQIKESQLDGSQIISDRFKALELLPKGGVVAEVGTLAGAYAKKIFETLKPKELHIFDIDFSHFDDRHFKEQINDGTVVLHHGDSSTELAKMPEAYFDFIYIDGDHSYKGASKDTKAAHLKLKPGGHMTFNDYTQWSVLECKSYGVMGAANELINEQNYMVRYLALHVEGYHDLICQKPD